MKTIEIWQLILESVILERIILQWFTLKTESQEAKQETPSPDETPASTPMAEEAPTIEVEVTDKVGGEEEVKVTEEEVKDTWEEDTKDAWDASSEEEEEDEEDAAPPKGRVKHIFRGFLILAISAVKAKSAKI